MKKIQFTYDKEARALYMKIGKGRIAKTIEHSPGFFIDYDKEDRIIGIEILNITSTSDPNKIILDIKKLQKART